MHTLNKNVTITKLVDRVSELNLKKDTNQHIFDYDNIKYRFEEVNVDDLHIVDELQRLLIPAKIKTIAKAMDLALFGVVLVVELPDGRYVTCDGQQRAAAAILAGYTSVPCIVMTLGLEDAGKIFIKTNDVRTRVSAVAKFVAKLHLGHEKETQIYDVVTDMGFDIGEVSNPLVPTITKIPSLTYVIKKDKNRANFFFTRKVLGIMKHTWPDADPRGTLMKSICLFLDIWEQQFYPADGRHVDINKMVSFFKWLSTPPIDGVQELKGPDQEQIFVLNKGDSTGEKAAFRQMLLFSRAYNEWLRNEGKSRGFLDIAYINHMEKTGQEKKYVKG